MNEALNHVANLGFPIAVSVFLLVRIESKLENLTLSIHDLAKSIEGLGQK
ncbi:YvrJ family protein [Serpentinicella sp. ANB-PHB4]|nr:YvrJ family protein [Serpentinicella sp. ANB-PHB4]MDR5659937.1 YvrJ family protein [Serpentinicella sp. ANB-PHB4]